MCSITDSQNFFIKFFARYKVCLFPILLNPKIVKTGYTKEIYSPIFFADEFSGLFEHPSIFLINIFVSA